MLTVEEMLGGELTGTELAELINAVDPLPKSELDGPAETEEPPR